MRLNRLAQTEITSRLGHLAQFLNTSIQLGLTVIGGTTIGWLMIEVALRLFTPFLPYQMEPYLNQKLGLWLRPAPPQFMVEHQTLWEADDDLRERLKPNMDVLIHGNPEYPVWPVKTNSLGFGPAGFRDTSPNRDPFAVVLGDSFGFGMGVAQAQIWSERLEQEIGLPFVNLSQTGASSLQEARIYARYGRPLTVRMVFWLYFQNDLKDNLRFAQWLDPTASIPQAVRQPSQHCAGPLHTMLQRYSLAYELILFSQRACHYSDLVPQPGYQDVRLNLTFCLDHDICDLEVQNRMLADGWPYTRQALEETLALLKPTGAKLIIVIVPSKEQVYWPQFQQVATFPTDYNIDRLVEPIRQFCQAQQLACLDLTPAFCAKAQQGEQLYFPVDIHWNEQGHALAAELIGHYLRQKNLLP